MSRPTLFQLSDQILLIPKEKWEEALFYLLFATILFLFLYIRRRQVSKIKQIEIENSIRLETRKSLINDKQFENQMYRRLQDKFFEEIETNRKNVDLQIKEKDREINLLNLRVTDLENELQDNIFKFNQANEEATGLRRNLDELQEVKRNIDEISDQLRKVLDDNKNLRKTLETRELSISDKDREILELKFQNRVLQDDVIAKEQEISVKNEAIQEFISRIKESEVVIEQLRKRIQHLEEDMEKLKGVKSE